MNAVSEFAFLGTKELNMSIAEILNEEFGMPTLLKRMGGVSCSGVSLYENDDAFFVEAKVPGVRADEIKVSFQKGNLLIEAISKEEKKDVKVHFRSSASYSYLIPLPEERIDANASLEALCKDGILSITFPKAKVAKPMSITVKSAS
jgi:HSP20 family protein